MRQLDPQERLAILRQTDRAREWYSLDDQRVCAVCQATINGRQIKISGEPGAYTVHCPTNGCPSNFNHWWFLHQLADARASLHAAI